MAELTFDPTKIDTALSGRILSVSPNYTLQYDPTVYTLYIESLDNGMIEVKLEKINTDEKEDLSYDETSFPG